MKCKRPYTCAIIAAAGSGKRMGAEFENKLLVKIGALEVVAHSVSAYEQAQTVDEIILVTRPDLLQAMEQIVREGGFHKVSAIVAGGQERQDSVFNALNAISKNAEYICIHDAARPFISAEIIDNVNEKAYIHKAAAAAVAVKDTIKAVDESGFITNTVDRNCLRAVQTPQSFELNLYRLACGVAMKEKKSFTDDCQLIENIGGKVYLEQGSYRNIKITTKEDVAYALFLLNSEI